MTLQNQQTEPTGQENLSIPKSDEPNPESPPESSPGKTPPPSSIEARLGGLYRRLQETQQKLEKEKSDRETDSVAFSELKKQYTEMAEAFDQIQDKVDASSAPDPNEDLPAYLAHHDEKLIRKIAKVLGPKQTPPPRQQPQNQGLTYQQEVNKAVQIALHEDYDDVIAEIQPDIDNDPVLRNQIWNSPDPFKAAYKYGIDKRNRSKQTQDNLHNQTYTEDGRPPGPSDDSRKTLTPEEKVLIRKLGVSEEKFISRREKMRKAGRLRR